MFCLCLSAISAAMPPLETRAYEISTAQPKTRDFDFTAIPSIALLARGILSQGLLGSNCSRRFLWLRLRLWLWLWLWQRQRLTATRRPNIWQRSLFLTPTPHAGWVAVDDSRTLATLAPSLLSADGTTIVVYILPVPPDLVSGPFTMLRALEPHLAPS